MNDIEPVQCPETHEPDKLTILTLHYWDQIAFHHKEIARLKERIALIEEMERDFSSPFRKTIP